MSIYSSAVNKPISTMMIFLAIIVLGVASYIELPIDLYPKMDPPFITVMATYPGANAADIEENVSKILEDQLNAVDKLKELSSVSYDNLSVVSLEFDWEVDIAEASNDVRDAVDKAMQYLPDDMDRPTIMRINTSSMPIIMYAITADGSYSGVNKILEDKVITRLNRIEGIASASLFGAPERVVYVELDPNQLDAYNLNLEQLSSKIQAENIDVSSGNLKIGLMDYTLRVEGEFQESREINDIVLGVQNERTIYLKDVARVRDTIKDITLEQMINGKSGCVLMVTKQTDANAVEIAERTKEEIETVMDELPSDIKLQIIFDNSDFIVSSINNLQSSLMYALIFVVLVVFIFLGRWRATFIVALTIPISLIVAFIYLLVTDESLNIISLASLSIAIGMVVDDAIVVLENITKHIDRGSHPREAAKYGTNEVWLSVIVTTLVTVAVFFPLTMVTGMTGILFKQLGWIVCITVCTSTVTAISLTPMLSSQLLRVQEKEDKTNKKFSFYYVVSGLFDKLDAAYEKLIRIVLNHKITTIFVMFAIFVGSIFLAGGIKTDFMPQNDESQLNVYIKMQQGQRVEETKRIGLLIEKTIEENIPEIRLFSMSYGMEEEATFASMFNTTGNNIVNMRIRTVDIHEREKTVFELADEIREILKGFPEVLEYTIGTSSAGAMAGSNTVDIEVIGHDFDATTKIAMQLAKKAENIKGATDIKISRNEDKSELQIFLNRDKLAEHALTTAVVGTYMRNRIYGFRDSKYKEDGEEYDIIVRLDEEYRTSLTQLVNLQLTDGYGQKVRLGELGDVRENFSPPNIERKNKQRYVKVSIAPAAGVSLEELVVGAREIINELDNVPDDISLYIGGTYEDQAESNESLSLLLLLSIMLVYIVMAAQFESFKMPFIIMLSIPFAMSGVILALLFTNTTLSVVAALGAIMLVGIVTKNGIVLIDFINLMRERGYKLNEAIASACRSRLRPVLMTSLTTILGMVPMALSVGEGSETWKPMGIAVIGGMIFSTIITMIIVPAVYAVMDRSGSRNKKKNLSKDFHFMEDFDKSELNQ